MRVRVDLTRLVREVDTERARGRVFTLGDVFVRAAALAAREHPRVNAVVEGDGLRLLGEVHVGVIAATPQGPVTCVVRHADRLGVEAVGARVRDVRARVVAGRARADDVTGATLCVSNLGMYGVEEFGAVILPPNVAMLAVGAAADEVIAEGGAIRVARTVRLTLSADHRALDGVEAALFLRTLGRLLADPARVLTEVTHAVPAWD